MAIRGAVTPFGITDAKIQVRSGEQSAWPLPSVLLLYLVSNTLEEVGDAKESQGGTLRQGEHGPTKHRRARAGAECVCEKPWMGGDQNLSRQDFGCKRLETSTQ